MTPTKILIPLLLLFAPFLGAVEEYHLQPGEIFIDGLNELPHGGTLYLSGPITEYEQKIKVSGRFYTKENPLVIDGQWKTESHQPMDFSDCGWVTVKGVLCYAGCGLNSNTTDYSKVLQHITVEDCLFKYGRIFSGGYSFHHITIRNCTIQEICYSGKETHGIYFSGGHWTSGAGMPHPHDILVEGCTFRSCGGRHGLQVNGCFTDVKVIGNDMAGCCLTGFQGIGIDGCEVAYNRFVFCNRGDTNAYDYNDQLPPSGSTSRGYLDVWRQVHHPNDNWNIHHNTFFVGPHEWYDWQNKSSVKDRPGILFNNELAGSTYFDDQGVEFDLDYEPTVHYVHDNVFISPWANMIEFHDPWSLAVTHVKGNMFWTYDPSLPPLLTVASDVVGPGDPTAASIAQMEQWWPQLYAGNIWDINPQIKKYPVAPHCSTIPPINYEYPHGPWNQDPPYASFDYSLWEVGQPDLGYIAAEWNLYSQKAANKGKGAFEKGLIWTRKGWVRGSKPNPVKGMGGLAPENPDKGFQPANPDGGRKLKMTRDEFMNMINKRKIKKEKDDG